MAVFDDMRLKPHVRAAADEIRRTFGITNIGGFATTGHMSNSDHYRGLALDVMTVAKGQQVANWAQANAQRLGITYIIWNRGIWDSRNNKGWTVYHGTSPHTDHVHLSFSDNGSVDNFQGTPSPADNTGCLGWLSQIFGI